MPHINRYIFKYFGEKGLTPSSATHIANLAKEYYRGMEKKLEGLSFCNTYIQSVACGDRIQVRKATSESDFASIPTILEKIGKAKSLIAWLREAVKAQQLLVKSSLHVDYDLHGEIDVEWPEGSSKPVFNDNPSDEDVINDEAELIMTRYAKDMDDLSFDFWCEFKGKLVELDEVKKHPLDISRPNRRIYRAQCVSSEVINKAYVSIVVYDLVERYGNWDSKKIKRVYNKRYDVLHDEYLKKRDEIRKQRELYLEALKARNKKLIEQYKRHRIIIPDILKEIYEEISLLGKKKD